MQHSAPPFQRTSGKSGRKRGVVLCYKRLRVRTRTRSLTLTHTHAHTAARGESARRDSNVLGAGSLDAQEARGAPAARAPAWAFSLPAPLSVHRPSIRSPHRPPVPPHAPNGPTQGFAFAAPLRGAGEKGALPLIPPTPAGFPLPLLRSLLKGGSPPGKRPLPPGLSPSQECEPHKSRVSVSACCDLCP